MEKSLKKIKSLFNRKPQIVNYINSEGMDSFIYIWLEIFTLDNKILTKLLIDLGIDINRPDNEGVTPFMHACAKSNSISMIKLLVDCGANINQKTSANWFSLTLYMKYHGPRCKSEIVKLLLDSGANINDSTNGWSPLIHAARYGANIELVKLLLDRGADIEAKSKHGRTALMHIAKHASSSTELNIVKLLLSYGTNIDTQDIDGWTPLMAAIYNIDKTKYIGIVKLLIENGADVRLFSKSYGDALLISTERDLTENIYKVVELLLKAGALVNINYYRHTPLQKVINKYGQSEHPFCLNIVKLLLKYNAKIDEIELSTAKEINELLHKEAIRRSTLFYKSCVHITQHREIYQKYFVELNRDIKKALSYFNTVF